MRDHVLPWNSVQRDYKNKEQRKQVKEDIDMKIRSPTGNFSSPVSVSVMGCLQLAPTGCTSGTGRTNDRTSLRVYISPLYKCASSRLSKSDRNVLMCSPHVARGTKFSWNHILRFFFLLCFLFFSIISTSKRSSSEVSIVL